MSLASLSGLDSKVFAYNAGGQVHEFGGEIEQVFVRAVKCKA